MTSSSGRPPTRLYRLIVARMMGLMGLSAVAFLGISTASPHDLMRPELNTWFKSLQSKAAVHKLAYRIENCDPTIEKPPSGGFLLSERDRDLPKSIPALFKTANSTSVILALILDRQLLG